MSKMSGLVAILGDGGSVVSYRDLGPDPIDVKPGMVLPVVDVRPDLGARQHYGDLVVVVGESEVTRTWPVENDPLPALTKRQICGALIRSGTTLDPDAWIENALSFIQDPVEKALALNDWRNAQEYDRDHQLFNNADLLAGVGLTSGVVDQLWALGSTLLA